MLKNEKSPDDFSSGLHLNMAGVERFADFKRRQHTDFREAKCNLHPKTHY